MGVQDSVLRGGYGEYTPAAGHHTREGGVVREVSQGTQPGHYLCVSMCVRVGAGVLGKGGGGVKADVLSDVQLQELRPK
eukprot:1159076-Pelagomonas_calceolata.AAC.4